MRIIRIIRFRVLVVLALTLSLAASGLAHKSAQAPLDPDLKAFLDMGGTLEGLCGTVGKPGTATPDCEACRLADTTLAPTCASDPVLIQLRVTQRMQHLAQLRHHAKPRDPSQQTRAPPLA